MGGAEEGADVDVAGRVALVTGASSGIGRATATALARRGARVLVHGRDPRRTRDVADRLGSVGLLGDLTESGAADDLVARASAVHGRLDLLVANAGVGGWAPFVEMTTSEIDDLLAVDLVAPIRLVRAALPAMVERGRGHLVLVTSIAGRTGVAGESVYAAAKAGLDAFAESLRLELEGTRVGVTVVVPGVVDTRFFDSRGGPPERRVPRRVSAERVAAAITEAVAHDRPEVYGPAWLRVAPGVRGVAPGLFRRLSSRYGEPVRSHGPEEPGP
jgi:short-subunit dehydrogenase